MQTATVSTDQPQDAQSSEQDAFFDEASKAIFNECFPDRPCMLKHNLVGHPLLAHDALIALADSLPDHSREFHSGQIEFSQPDEDAIPGTGLTYLDTIKQIQTAKAWMSLRTVNQNPSYSALLDAAIADINPAGMLPDGKTHLHEGFVFVSSPGTNTPFHFDPEYNILMQIEGEKTVTVFPAGDPDIITPQDEEELHATGKCNIAFDEERFGGRGASYLLRPGDALYMPVKAPHYVKNGDTMSISFSITWRSQVSDFDRRVHLFNRRLRNIGIAPTTRGRSQSKDAVKAMMCRLLERFGN